MIPTVGHHALIELFGCDMAISDDPDAVMAALRAAASAMGSPVLAQSFHRFEPHGVSGILLISESHISCHSWPESGYVAVDVYTCGAVHPRRAVAVLCSAFRARRWLVHDVIRGLVAAAPQGRIQREMLLTDPTAAGRPLPLGSLEAARVLQIAGVLAVEPASFGPLVRADEGLWADDLLLRLSSIAGVPLTGPHGRSEASASRATGWQRRSLPLGLLQIGSLTGGGWLQCARELPDAPPEGASLSPVASHPLQEGQIWLIRADQLWFRLLPRDHDDIPFLWMGFRGA